MSDTVQIFVSQTAWTDITDGADRGLVTNNSHHTIRYRQAAAQPALNDTFGHELHPQSERYFNLKKDERWWALGFHQDARVALTKSQGPETLISGDVSFTDSPNIDASGRLRSSEPFGVFDNKNIHTRNRNQWEEVITGAILTYNTLVGTFTVGEDIRGTLPAGLIAIGTVVTDNGATSMTIDANHNDFQVGDTITGQTSGATAVLVSTNTGSDIQHDYDTSCVILTAGTAATDSAIRQTHRYHAYVPGKSQKITTTFTLGTAKANVIRRVGYYDDLNGLFLEQNGTVDVAMVVRTSTSGSPVPGRVIQADWNLDTMDGSGSSEVTLDLSRIQIFIVDFLWLGAGRVRFGFKINGMIIYVHEVQNANVLNVPFMKTPTLPVRYETANSGVPSSPTTLFEVCCSVESEGGYTLPGLEFSTSNKIAKRALTTALTPVLAIRLKNAFPAGQPNRKTAKFLRFGSWVDTNDVHIELQHIHEPIDVVGSWTDIGGGSAVEYSTDISAVTGRPAHEIEGDYAVTSSGNKGGTTSVPGEFLNFHGFISQNFASDASEMFVVYSQSLIGAADILAHITWIEFD